VLQRWWERVDRVGLAVLAFALAVFVPFCWSYGMWDPWESHYGEAARQILERGDWWTLYWEDAYFFSKPILLFWLMGLGFAALGVSEFAARLPVALCAVAGVWSVYWGVASVTGRRRCHSTRSSPGSASRTCPSWRA
jgi:4-amino-4-deoxy-L-arabinose transferase-like glycosyltransferase